MRTPWVATATITLCLVLTGIPAAAQSSPGGGFRPTGAPAESRVFHTATLLADGRVLVVGGMTLRDTETLAPLASAEVWDPAAETFEPAGSLSEARAWHTATALSDGRVLVVGGALAAEIWDPATETFGPTGSLSVGRLGHTATLLADGRVLVIGGDGEAGAVAEAEVWDPATGTWELAGSLTVPSDSHTAMHLADGRVLVIGATASGTITNAEVWDPATAAFDPTPMPELGSGRHSATLLADGDVLFIEDTDRYGEPIAAQVWDPATGAMSPTGSLSVVRMGHTATLLADGRILVVGGWNPMSEGGEPASSEIWDPAIGTFSPAGSPTAHISMPTVTALPDGRALVVGLAEPEHHVFLPAAEVWEPGGDG